MSDALKKLKPNARWFPLAGITNRDTDGKERLCQRLMATQDLFDVVRAYIEEKRQTLDRGEESLEDFNDGAWPYKQAFRAGKRAAYSEVEEFLPDANDPKKQTKSE